jgi:hypothetical protein
VTSWSRHGATRPIRLMNVLEPPWGHQEAGAIEVINAPPDEQDEISVLQDWTCRILSALVALTAQRLSWLILSRLLGNVHHAHRDLPHVFAGVGELASEEFRLDAHRLFQFGRMNQFARVLEGRLDVLLGERKRLF